MGESQRAASPICPGCGRGLRPESRFCDGCGQAVGRPEQARAPTAELRTVTVLFADLKGFTALSETIDPDDVHDVVQRVFAVTDAELRAHQGLVEKHMGDAVMALFGHPRAGEDDAERAVRAALAIQTKLHALADALVAEGLPRIAMRIGLNTGRVLVGSVGERGGETSVYGDTVNVASRVQTMCPPGGVLVAEDTWRHLRGHFEGHGQPPVRVKGKAQPLSTWLVIAERPLRALARHGEVLGTRTRLIGREDEMRVLGDAWMALGEGARLMTVLGAPGTGKSRLAEELLDEAVRQGASVLRARGAAETLQEPYRVLAQLTREAARIDTSAVGDAVIKRLASWLGSVTAAAAVAELLGLARAAEPVDQRQALSALRRTLLDLARERPLVVALDDMQWVDSATREYVLGLVAAAEGLPVFLLATARPELLETTPDWGEAVPRSGRLWLAPLGDDAGRRLAVHLLHTVDGLPANVVEEIATRSGGIPYLAEELVKSLADRGILERQGGSWRFHGERLDGFTIPGTVEGLLQARLDRLEPGPLQVARVASVLGRGFGAAQLRALLSIPEVAKVLPGAPPPESTERALIALAEREIVRREEAEADSWIFAHDLMRDVAYQSLVKRARRRLHGEVAGWMESQATDAARRIEASAVARHYELAEKLEDAMRWHLRAGQAAGGVFAGRETLSELDTALDLLARLGMLQGPEAMAAWLARGEAYGRLGRLDEAEGDLERAQALARARGDQGVLAQTHIAMAFSAYQRGDAEQTLAHAERGAGIAAALDDERVKMHAQNILGIAWGSRGYFARAISYYTKATEFAERLGDRRRIAVQLSNTAINHHLLGQFDTALDCYRRALDIARSLEDQAVECVLLDNTGFVHLNLRQLEEAKVAFGRSVELARAIEDQPVLVEALTGLGETELALGNAEGAAAHGRESLALASQAGMKVGMGQALRLLGKVAETLDAGIGEDPESLYLRSIELLRETGERQELAESLLVLGAHLTARGQEEGGARHTGEARALFEALGMGWRMAGG